MHHRPAPCPRHGVDTPEPHSIGQDMNKGNCALELLRRAFSTSHSSGFIPLFLWSLLRFYMGCRLMPELVGWREAELPAKHRMDAQGWAKSLCWGLCLLEAVWNRYMGDRLHISVHFPKGSLLLTVPPAQPWEGSPLPEKLSVSRNILRIVRFSGTGSHSYTINSITILFFAVPGIPSSHFCRCL